jgi:hypothetical protein
MTDEALRNVIFVVTGSNLVAEQKDRPLAYFLKTQIDRYGGADPSRCGVVVGDHWYMSTREVQECPTISVGGPGVNTLSQHFWHRLPVALAVDNVFVIQADIAGQDLRASVWGMNHETTREAVQTFQQKGYLRHFLEAAWGETLEEPEAPAGGGPPGS